MNIEKWITENTASLQSKVVAITGSTGGLGVSIVRHLARLNASILMLNRNLHKSLALKDEVLKECPNADIEVVVLDLNSTQNVKDVCRGLSNRQIDYLILNAGIYNVPVTQGDLGYNNIFQVNFVSQYCLVKGLLPALEKSHGKVIAVGSIAHTFARLDAQDVDYTSYKKPSKIYGNSKRFLMFSLYELLNDNPNVGLAVVHPGVTLTNMTNHYHKSINWLVKFGIKAFFPSPNQAALSIIAGLFAECGYHEWIGPARCKIWGKPKLQRLKTCKVTESEKIYNAAEEVYVKTICQ